ncbi:membrane protein [Salmonella bongori NCTC 12419]|uniref:Membrane protein n=1 Tax=Salmonella bongori (strain ATCC 43975 / DSM 13772 / NCTC 12419) TaxID=218493 RepID=A0A0K0HB15_SALBC|nr:membrane protein [Salmonella bongori NCTC 12419]
MRWLELPACIRAYSTTLCLSQSIKLPFIIKNTTQKRYAKNLIVFVINFVSILTNIGIVYVFKK